MKFRLLFEGELRPRQQVGVDHVHAIRQHLHPQVKRLWEHEPLTSSKEKSLKFPDPNKEPLDELYARYQKIDDRVYSPLIGADLAAELDIVFLRQQSPGQLIGEGGDIDNRLKTLFDALRMPTKSEVQTLGTATASDETPLHCLLKDDALIHRVNVETDRLLKDASPRTVVAIIHVTLLVTRTTFGTLGLTAR
jgi:hypothetical protein